MKTTYSISLAATFLLLAAADLQHDARAQSQGEGYLTSGAKLKPILIGEALEGRNLVDEGSKFDGHLNIVIDTPYQMWNAMGTYVHLAAYDPQFKPAEGAIVYVNGKSRGRTDKNGTFVFSEVPNPTMHYGYTHTIDVVYSKGGKKYMGSVKFSAYPRTQSFESVAIFVYTDRGVYNPGQTIHIRAIAWSLKDDFRPLQNKQIELLLKNDRGRVVAGGGVETDRWGIIAMDIPLPENAPEGNYTLEANYERESASALIRVERFTPPVIEIKHTLGRFLLSDLQELPFDVTLSYFGGGTFKSGRVHLRVLAKGQVAHEEKREVKGTGPHRFVLGKDALAKVRQSLKEDDYAQIKIAVSDDFGRKDEVKREMRYTSNPYTAVVEMDKDQYTTGETARIMVRVTDLDKVPARDKEIKLVVEGRTYKARTDTSGLAKFEYRVPKRSITGKVYIENVKNPVAHAYINWVDTRPMSSEIPQGYVRELEETDIVIRFPTDFVPKEKVVHVDIVDSSGAIIGAVLVPVMKEGERYIAKGKFRAPAWGSMLLTLFCIGAKGNGPVGLLTDGQNLPVLPQREIQIDLLGVPQKVTPGSKIEVSAIVKDAKGKKIDAAVGASIVDEAVLSLLDPLEKTPMDRFYNPQLKVLSTTGSKILTWPVVTRNWGYPLYDIALPPFGFRAGGPNQKERQEGKGYGGGPAKAKFTLKEEGSAVESVKESAKAPAVMHAYAAEHELGESSREPVAEKADVSITIRTNFPETSFWAPDLEAKDGNLKIASFLPDSITTQTLTLIASDDKGGVGMAKAKVEVSQDIYVRSNLPATLTVGDSVEVFTMVKNLTKKETSCKISLQSEALEVIGGNHKEVAVSAEGAAAASFVVKPTKAGPAVYEVKAECPGFSDAERRHIFLRPLGIPDKIIAKGEAKRGKAFRAKVKVSGTDQYLYSFLHVSFPTAVPVLQGLEALLDQPGGAIDVVSSKGLVAAMVYRYLLQTAYNEQAIANLRPFLQQLMARLLMTQNIDGGWGWHFNILRAIIEGEPEIVVSKSNPYMTAQSLEGLVEMKRAGLPVPEAAVAGAMQFLADSMNSDGLWSIADIAFWEGNTKQVQEGVSAEIFRVMADACEVYPKLISHKSIQTVMDRLSSNFENYLSIEEVRDPMALANAAMGVYSWKKANGTMSKELNDKLRAIANKLILLRKEAYWEPSWFNAFGGTLEATAAAMMFLQKLDKEGFESELRRSIQYILSTQESLGAWHNARGTAAAIRALLLIPPTEEEIPSTVEVYVNDQLVEKVGIAPDDPYLSAVKLRQVEITKYLKHGDNVVEVIYDGNLKAQVTLMLKKWSSKKAFSAVRSPSAPKVEVSRTYEGEAAAEGAPVEVKISLDIKDHRGPLIVKEPLPSNADIEGASLDKLVQERTISGYELNRDAVTFYLAPDKEGKIEITYRLEGERRGTALHPGTLISTVENPEAFVCGAPTRFNVQ